LEETFAREPIVSLAAGGGPVVIAIGIVKVPLPPWLPGPPPAGVVVAINDNEPLLAV
jgi:hypothetical protein